MAQLFSLGITTRIVNDKTKTAYRHLLYVALLAIRNDCLSRGRESVSHLSGGDSIGAVVSPEPLPIGYTIWRSLVLWISPNSTSHDFGRSILVCASDFPARGWSGIERFSTSI
jgi:hypothetical protein